MFDAFSGRGRPGYSLSASREQTMPLLEPLEARDVPAIISGFVYADMNGNGLQDAGEVGLANSPIQLFDGANRLVGTTVTDSRGMYEFSRSGAATPGPGSKTYELTFDQIRTNANRSGTLPMFDASLGTLTSVEIIAEGNISSSVVLENLEAESSEMSAELKGTLKYTVNGRTLTATPTRTLQGTVDAFDGTPDLQGSSAQDFGITQMTGSFPSVTLTNSGELAAFIGGGTISVSQSAKVQSCAAGTGNLLAMIRSTTEGKVKVVYNYQPGNEIGPGMYKVVQAVQTAGFIDGYETKGGLVAIAGSQRTDFITIGVVNRTDVFRNNSFGEIRPSILSGTVYFDSNRSGSLTAGEGGLGGVLVTLTGMDMFGQQVTRTTVTNSSGFYAFGSLTAGNYTVRESQPAGYMQGTTTAGSRGGTVSGDSISMRLDQATNAINYNFGEILNGTTPQNPPSTTGGGKGNFFYTVGYGPGWKW